MNPDPPAATVPDGGDTPPRAWLVRHLTVTLALTGAVSVVVALLCVVLVWSDRTTLDTGSQAGPAAGQAAPAQPEQPSVEPGAVAGRELPEGLDPAPTVVRALAQVAVPVVVAVAVGLGYSALVASYRSRPGPPRPPRPPRPVRSARRWRVRRLLLAGAVGTVVVVAVVLLLAGTGYAAAPAGVPAPPPPAPAPTATDLDAVLRNLRNWLIGILVTVATLYFTVGGARYMAANGDPGEVDAAKRAFRNAAIGYGLAVLAPLFLTALRSVVGA